MLVAGLFALSVGLAGGLWAVVDAVALRPLPYPSSRDLVIVWESHPERGLMAVTPANFLDWRARLRSLSHAAGMASFGASLSGRETPVRVAGTRVTEEFFDVLGVKAAVGRTVAGNDFTGDGRRVVLADSLWERQFARAPDVVGASVLIDGAAYTVVGVMPRSFKTFGKNEIWVPWVLSAQERAERRFHQMGVLARLAPPFSAPDAERELHAVYRQLASDHPDTTARWSARVTPLHEFMIGDSRRALTLLGAAVLALVLVASVNVVALLSAWFRSRRQELLVRMSLGASSTRIVRLFLTETLVWASVGMGGGVLLATAFVRIFGAVGVSPVLALEYDFAPAVDTRVVLAMAGLLTTIALLTTLVPAFISARRAADLVPRRASPVGVRGQRIALALQVSLAVVLLGVSAALVDGFRDVSSLAGPALPTMLGVDVSLAEGRYRDDDSQRQFFERLLTALEARPELRGVAAASYVPPARIDGNVRFEIEGRATPSDEQTTLVSATSPQLFRLLGIPVLRGRTIEDRDGRDAPHVAAISRALARRYWRDEDPIGHRITLVGLQTPITIMGVVEDVQQPLSGDPRAESVLYLSFRQVPWPFMTVLVEPADAPAPALQALRAEVARLDPAQALSAARPIDDIRREWLTLPRLRTQIVAIFGLSAVVVTLAGLYARVTYAVVARRRELAIRQAIGARPADVIRAVSGEALAITLAGLAIGFAVLPSTLSAIARFSGGLPTRPGPLVAAIAMLFVCTASASAYGPARRASRANAADVLRAN
jgi:putative ABC transport system permease protein